MQQAYANQEGLECTPKNEDQRRPKEGGQPATNQIASWPEQGRSEVIDTIDSSLEFAGHFLLDRIHPDEAEHFIATPKNDRCQEETPKA